MVSSILLTGRSEVAQIAKGMSSEVQMASRVKKVKRWLQNEYCNYEEFYFPYANELLKVLSKQGELVFSIDGSVMGKGCMCLMFSVIYKGKGIPIIWDVYKSKKGHLPEQYHKGLLKRLSSLVPQDCKVVVVGDGEFDGCDFQKDIKNLSWDYVLRTGAQIEIEEYEGELFKLKTLILQKGDDLILESVKFTQKRYGPVNILVWHGKEHEKPIYLVTNLEDGPAIKSLYIKRFKIEPFFRDQKSKGFHIQRSGLRDPKRLSKLLIATCLAYLISIMTGIKALKSIFYDRADRTDGHFLSLFQLGIRFIGVLVDLRQWRAFSWKRDWPIDHQAKQYCLNCVPF